MDLAAVSALRGGDDVADFLLVLSVQTQGRKMRAC